MIVLDLLELLVSMPEVLFHIGRGIWWLVKNLIALVVVVCRSMVSVARWVCCGVARWFTRRGELRDIPAATVIRDDRALRARSVGPR